MNAGACVLQPPEVSIGVGRTGVPREELGQRNAKAITSAPDAVADNPDVDLSYAAIAALAVQVKAMQHRKNRSNSYW